MTFKVENEKSERIFWESKQRNTMRFKNNDKRRRKNIFLATAVDMKESFRTLSLEISYAESRISK